MVEFNQLEKLPRPANERNLKIARRAWRWGEGTRRQWPFGELLGQRNRFRGRFDPAFGVGLSVSF
jgi:hypothetical protein